MTNLVKLPTILPQQPRDYWVSPDNPQLLLLRRWQADRLTHTFADLHAVERYRLALISF